MSKNLDTFLLIFLTMCLRSTKPSILADFSGFSGFSPLSDCLIELLKEYRLVVRKMSISYQIQKDNICTDMIEGILQKTDIPVVLNFWEIPITNLDIRYKSEIVLACGLSTNITRLVKETLKSQKTRYFVIFGEKEAANCTKEYLLEFFQQFWSFEVLNVFAFVPKSHHQVHVYGYSPYAGNCESVDLVLVDKWNGSSYVKAAEQIKVGMRLKNLHLCQINISAVEKEPNLWYPKNSDREANSVSGFEGNILHALAEKLNFTPKFMKPSDAELWGSFRPWPTGSSGQVYNGTCELGAGKVAPFMDRFQYLDFSVGLGEEECPTFVVPKGIKDATRKTTDVLIIEFSTPLWGLFVGVLVIFSSKIWGINRALYQEEVLSSIPRSFFFTIAVLLQQPVTHPASNVLKMFFLSWILFSFLMVLAYQAVMNTNLMISAKEDIETTDQLLETNLTLKGTLNAFKSLKSPFLGGEMGRMRDKFVISELTVAEEIEAIATKRDAAYLTQLSTLQYFATIRRKKNYVSFLKECIFTFQPIWLFRKDSPLIHSANEVINGFKEGGLIWKVTSEFSKEVPASSSDFSPLSLSYFTSTIIVSLSGFILALLCFFTECLTYRFSRFIRKPKILYWCAFLRKRQELTKVT